MPTPADHVRKPSFWLISAVSVSRDSIRGASGRKERNMQNLLCNQGLASDIASSMSTSLTVLHASRLA